MPSNVLKIIFLAVSPPLMLFVHRRFTADVILLVRERRMAEPM